MSNVNVTGMEQLERELERRFGRQAMERISDKALKNASLVFKRELLSQLRTFSGVPGTTGATVDEVTFTEPYWKDGVRTITVHWKGPKGRYRIIHLNEFGTVKNPNPKGKGAIARAIQASASAYRQAIVDTYRGAL